MLTTLIWIVMTIAFLLAILLIIPIRIFISGCVDDGDGLDYRLKVNWAFGLISFQAASGSRTALYILGLRVYQIPWSSGKNKQKPEKSAKKKPPFLKWYRWARKNLPPLNRILSSFARAVFLKGFISATIGLQDPADTAIVGIIDRLIQINSRHFYLKLTNVYEREMIQIRSQIQATLIIGWLGSVVIGLLLEGQAHKIVRNIKQTQYKEVLP